MKVGPPFLRPGIMPAPVAVLYMRTAMSGFVAGIVPAPFVPHLGYLAAVALLLLMLALWLRRRTMLSVAALFAALAAACSLMHSGFWLSAKLPVSCTRVPVLVEGTVVSLPRRQRGYTGSDSQRFEFAVGRLAPLACDAPRKLLITYYGPEVIAPGQGWRFRVRLRPPRGQVNPGSGDFARWYAQSRIHGVGSSGQYAQRAPQWNRPWRSSHHRLRARLSAAVTAALAPGMASAVMQAITVADKSGIRHRLWVMLQHLGINHLLVISGLHVGMVAGLGWLLGALLARWLAAFWPVNPRYCGALLALVFSGFYTALAGFSMATTRAFLMIAIAVIAVVTARRVTPWQVLLALVLVLAANPLAVFGSALTLSFGAVAALLWLGGWSRHAYAWQRWSSVHAYMSLVMLPLGAIWFGGASAIAAPVNFLSIPFFTFFLVPLALAGSAAVLLGATGWGAMLWQWAAAPLQVVMQWSQGLELERGFVALTPSAPAIALAVFGLVAAVVPGGRVRRILSLAIVVPLFLAPRPPVPPVLALLDVGQGTAVVFMAAGRALLYDTGGGDPEGPNQAQRVVIPYLRASGIRTLDTLVISHGDLDHAAGHQAVAAAMAPARTWYGGLHSAGHDVCRAGQRWRWADDIVFQFLAPGAAWGSSNNRSCVLLIDVRGQRILLAGDIESAMERELIRYWGAALSAEVLLVGHHGSATSTSQSWLNRVDPDLALLSYGYGNRFGHPAPVVLRRLQAQGVVALATARHGALELELSTSNQWQIRAHRKYPENWRL